MGFEEDPTVLQRRQKTIDKAKESEKYQKYANTIQVYVHLQPKKISIKITE